jgi:hypothetical protein
MFRLVTLIGPKLTHPERIVAWAMADMALDRDTERAEAGIYYGGWENLALWLGYPEYTPTAKEAVRRAINGLVDAKVIEQIGPGGGGHRAVYRFTFPLVRGPG